MKARILKRVTNGGKVLNPGDIVDISGWRNAKTLVSGRYVEILDEQAEEKKPLVADVATDKPKTPAKIKSKQAE